MYIEFMDSPVGTLEIQASEVGICCVSFVETSRESTRPNELTSQCKQQLSEYFSNDREVFDLPLDQEGTDFQKLVWQNLVTIPYGKSASYKDIADKANNPKAVRAVGAANGRNPISIIVPCHRVIGSTGKLTG